MSESQKVAFHALFTMLNVSMLNNKIWESYNVEYNKKCFRHYVKVPLSVATGRQRAREISSRVKQN
ncbi:CLUMA_CG015691, isoform A [Clunio marinus]|uniref:CLUMA_CG015691, isoform A n=1 Tax=Clunio marinus TaxID=568069 RepID=A0A1J1ISH5_9DIPT|nr:CLUMA_CG015691, isoform A [Clunio marinus]